MEIFGGSGALVVGGEVGAGVGNGEDWSRR